MPTIIISTAGGMFLLRALQLLYAQNVPGFITAIVLAVLFIGAAITIKDY